jgi:hypothetical protein
LSQHVFALDAGVSTRHLSLLERRKARSSREAELTADPQLEALLAELRGYPGLDRHAANAPSRAVTDLAGVAVPLQPCAQYGDLVLLSMTMVFGTALDIALAALAVEAFFPANAATADLLSRFVPPMAAASKHRQRLVETRMSS